VSRIADGRDVGPGGGGGGSGDESFSARVTCRDFQAQLYSRPTQRNSVKAGTGTQERLGQELRPS
jgi:hypothetical protein